MSINGREIAVKKGKTLHFKLIMPVWSLSKKVGTSLLKKFYDDLNCTRAEDLTGRFQCCSVNYS